MSEFIETVKTMKPKVAIKPPKVKQPLIDTSQSSPSVAVMADIINNTAAPFQGEPDPNKGALGQAEFYVGMVMGVVGAPFELLDTGFALVTAPLAALMPGLPAATLMAPHLGMPHGHAHPPSLIPPNPVPIPLPSIGTVMCAGCVSVLIGGIPAARAGDVGLAVTCGSLSPAFEVYTGSSNTWIGGSRAARMTDITRHCNPASAMGKLGAVMGAVGLAAGAVSAGATSAGGDALQASMQAAQLAADAVALAMSALLGKDPGVPPALGALLVGNPTVLIGGFPLPDLLDVLGAALKGLKKLGDAAGKSPAVKKALAKVGLCNDPGEPINTFSGVVYNDFEDYRAPSGFTWERHYRSNWNVDDGPLGHGFRHFYDRRLWLLRKRALYEAHDGEQVSIPRAPAGFVTGDGFQLTKVDGGHYHLYTDRDEELDFEPRPMEPPSARLVRYRKHGIDILLRYDEQDRLKTLVETAGSSVVETRFIHEESGRISEVQRGPRDMGATTIARYSYDNGCMVRWQDALGAAVHMRYDTARRMVRVEDRRCYGFAWHYDPHSGRCVRSSGDDGLLAVSATYRGNTSTFVEADGGEWTFKHFADGLVSHVIDPLQGVREYVRDEETGRIVKQIMPGGAEYVWLYDEIGKHVGREDPFGNVLPPEDEEPNPPHLLAHDGPMTAQAFLWGRPLFQMHASSAGLPSLVQRRLDAILPHPLPAHPRSEPVRDARNQVIEQCERDGSIRRFRRDAEGNIVAEQSANGHWALKSYSSWDLLEAETSPLGHVNRYEYTHRGEQRAVIDPNGNRTEYVRDPLHRIVEVHRYGQLYRSYLHAASGAVLEERDASGAPLIQYEADENGLHTSATLASGERYTYAYDPNAQISEASSTQHEVLREHEGRFRRRELRDGKGVEHTYCAGSHLARTTYFDRFHVRYHYESASMLCIFTPDGSVHRLWHTGEGAVRENGNGTSEVAVFDADQRLTARTCFRRRQTHAAPFWTTSYRYDADRQLVSSVEDDRGPQRYEYDADHRLVAHIGHRGERRYAYDSAGNLTRTARHGLVEYDAGNLTRHADFDHYGYDERRRRVKHDRRGGPIVHYTYDSRDQLVEARWNDRIEVWRAAYDGLGRRLWREYGGRRTDFYWDGDRLAAERNPDGRIRIYVYANADALAPFMWLDYAGESAAPESGKPHYLFTAPTGMPLRVEDASGTEVWRAGEIDAYGELDSGPPCPTRLRFAGHFDDEYLGLHYNRFRDYDPTLGRYLQPDPLGHAGGINLFAYSTNPLSEVDLRGLSLHKKRETSQGNGSGDGEGSDTQARPAQEGTARGPARQATEPNLAALPPGGQRTPEDNREARRFYRNNREEAMARWEQRTGQDWPTDENGVPQWCEHPRPLKDGGDPLHVEPGVGPDPNAIHNVPGPDGLTDHQRWGAMGPPARGKGTDKKT